MQKPAPGRLWRLFYTMLTISAFTFGGGFVIVSLMKRRLVEDLHWLEEDEMLDMTALAQTCPGAIAVNASILVGRRVAGIPGLIVAVAGTLVPPILILSGISMIYEAFAANEWVRAAMTGMQAGVAAVVTDVVLSLGGNVVKKRDAIHIALMVVAFVCGCLLKVNVLWIILGAALVGLTRALLRRKGGEGRAA